MFEPPDRSRDHELGMDREITRRDFLDGVALTIGGVMLAGSAAGGLATALGGCGDGTPALQTPSVAAYPPALTDLQGQTDAARTVPHLLRDGIFWDQAGRPEATGETYDLVVVGAGISGLSAAYLYAQADPGARILVLDTQDDFGGHAKRNEFEHIPGRRAPLIGYGGTESIDSPSVYSPQALAVLEGIGIALQRFRRHFDDSFWAGLGTMWFFDKETWGRDHTVVKTWRKSTREALRDAPVAEQAKRDLVMLSEAPKDWLPGMSQEAKKRKLSELTYTHYLADVVKVHPDVLKFLQNRPRDYWGYGADALGAIDAWADGHPGFDGLGLSWAKPYRANTQSEKLMWDATDPYIYHFPEGNAGIARLLVRALVPDALPGHTMEDEVLANLDYSRLDRAGAPVRIRLASPVVRVRNVGEPANATGVEVTYARDGRLHTVTAKGAVMACWYSMAPYIVDGLPEIQKTAGRFMTHIPLVYADILLGDRLAFQRLKMAEAITINPDSMWVDYFTDFPVSMDGYHYPMDYSQAGLVHLTGTLCVRGMSPRDGSRVGREALDQMPFADIERGIRDLMARTLGGGGFDPARDIRAITVNRWAHGYSNEYASPWDNAFYPDGPLPGEVAARPFGRITFAGTDRSSRAYTDAAIDAAYTAVNELRERM